MFLNYYILVPVYLAVMARWQVIGRSKLLQQLSGGSSNANGFPRVLLGRLRFILLKKHPRPAFDELKQLVRMKGTPRNPSQKLGRTTNLEHIQHFILFLVMSLTSVGLLNTRYVCHGTHTDHRSEEPHLRRCFSGTSVLRRFHGDVHIHGLGGWERLGG